MVTWNWRGIAGTKCLPGKQGLPFLILGRMSSLRRKGKEVKKLVVPSLNKGQRRETFFLELYLYNFIVQKLSWGYLLYYYQPSTHKSSWLP